MAEGNILCDAVSIYDAGSHCTSVGTRAAGGDSGNVSDTASLGDNIFISALCVISDSTKKYGNRRRLKC